MADRERWGEFDYGDEGSSEVTAWRPRATPGKISLTSQITPVHRDATASTVARGASERVARAASSSGQALPAPLRARLERSLGADLGGVRVHTGPASSDAAERLSANAYAQGQDIHFGPGKYDPESSAGQRLIAHEVAHTVQQGGAPAGDPQLDLQVSQPGDAHEVEAESFAQAFAFGGAVEPALQPVSRGTVSRTEIHRDGPVNKAEAQRELLAWNRQAQSFVDGNRQWLSANWIAYLSRTSQNPRLGWTEGVAGSTISNALGNLLTTLGEDLIKAAGRRAVSAAGAAIGTAIAPGVGTVIGFVIGVLVEQAAGMIFEAVTGRTEADDAASAASRRTGDLIQERTGTLDAEGGAALAQLSALFGDVQTKLTASTDQAEVDRILDWATAERGVTSSPASRGDRSLAETMLADWVLEHAGDEEDAASDTSEAQWEAARDEAFGEGDLDNHPELFAFQTRGEWAKAGTPSPAAQEMIERVRELTRDAADPAATVMASFDGRTFECGSTTAPDQLIAYVNENTALWDNLHTGQVEAVRNNRFRLRCTLDLTTADGSCYVDEWHYHIRFTNPDDIDWTAITEWSFDVSPD